jgi:hypothetical protein
MVAHLEPLHVYKLICTEEKINEKIVWFMVIYGV